MYIYIYVLFIWWDTQCHTPSTWGEIAIHRDPRQRSQDDGEPGASAADGIGDHLSGRGAVGAGEFPIEKLSRIHKGATKKGDY